MTSPTYYSERIKESTINTLLIKLIGQSNICRGGLPTDDPSPFPAHITVGEEMENVEIWDEDNGGWIALVPGVNGAPKNAVNSYGIAIELAYQLTQKYPSKQIKMFMLARGGAAMSQFPFPGAEGQNEYWATNTIPLAAVSRWAIARDAWNEAIPTMTEPYIDLGDLWIQGESDALDDTLWMSESHRGINKVFFDEWRELTGTKRIIVINIHPDLDPVDFDAPRVDNVRNGILANFNNGVYTHYRDSDDLTLRADFVHFDAASCQTLVNDYLIDIF